MGRRASRGAEADQEVSEDTWDKYLRISKKCKDHIFSAYQANYTYPPQTLKQAAISRGLYSQQVLERRVSLMVDTHNTTLKLEPAFPSAPFRDSKWGFYLQHTKSNGTSFFNFGADYSARHFLDFMINDKPFKWMSQESIMTSSNVVLRCEQGEKMEELLEYEMNVIERQWEIPEPYLSMWTKIRDGKKVEHAPTHEPPTPAPEKAPKRAKNERTARQSPEGLVTLAQIAGDLSIDPRDARAILRKSTIEKTNGAWAWPEAEVDNVKKALKGGA